MSFRHPGKPQVAHTTGLCRMLRVMLSSPIRSLAFLAAAAAAGWGAYELRGRPVASALLALLCIVLIALALVRPRRDRGMDALEDAGVSTLVFPPESKFEQSVLPPR